MSLAALTAAVSAEGQQASGQPPVPQGIPVFIPCKFFTVRLEINFLALTV